MSFGLQRVRTECTLTVLDQGDDPPHRLPIHDLAPDDGPWMIVDGVTLRYIYGDGSGWRLVGVAAHGVRAKVNGERGAVRVNKTWRPGHRALNFERLPDWVSDLAAVYTPDGAPVIPLPTATVPTA